MTGTECLAIRHALMLTQAMMAQQLSGKHNASYTATDIATVEAGGANTATDPLVDASLERVYRRSLNYVPTPL